MSYTHPAKRHHLTLAIVLSLLLIIGPPGLIAAPNSELPEIGAPSGQLLTPVEEQRLGREFMRSVRASERVVDDPLLAEYIQSLGNRLVEKSDQPGRAFTFFIIDNPMVNAFAGPGGYIGVYSGLLLATASESELASVMAHEIAHVTQQHLVRAFDNASRMSLPTAALLLAAVILGASVSPEAGQAAIVGVQAASLQRQINFTRHNEQEADRVGIKILAGAEFDPRAMPAFFNRLAKVNRLYESNAPEFLRTHPVTTNRIADAMGRAEDHPYRQFADSTSYTLVRARLQAHSFKSAEQAVVFFQQTLAERRYRNEDAQRYGYVLALIRNRQYGEAQQELARLLKKSPEEIAYLIASAELDRARDQAAQAIRTLETALSLYPSNYPLNLTYAETLLSNRQWKDAKGVLETLGGQLSADASLNKLLADAAGMAGNKAEAHFHLAQHHYLNGRLEPAVQQLEIALRDKELDYYLASKIQARLDQYRQLQANRKKDGGKRQ